jgi:hypothetical protein
MPGWLKSTVVTAVVSDEGEVRGSYCRQFASITHARRERGPNGEGGDEQSNDATTLIGECAWTEHLREGEHKRELRG